MSGGRREAYDQLLYITRMLDTSLVSLCETVIAELPEIADPQRTSVANALSKFATTLRDELERGGNFMKLAKTMETQAKELHESAARLAVVRQELQSVYTSISESSSVRTRLVVADEHLAAIQKSLVPLAPAEEF
ncbi:MAG: hypothetical protein M3N13_01445 [Candidatus Eremiobacteraeota bacterium]|nr:hypothetical protein [Candidatus Eremiobacteraeota bacterium]